MKKIILAISLIFSGLIFSQCDGSTKVFELDLSKPSKNSLIAIDSCSKTRIYKGLTMRTTRPVSLRLKNVNPFKYSYEINHNFINFFEEDFENSINEAKNVFQEASLENKNAKNDSVNNVDKELNFKNNNKDEIKHKLDILQREIEESQISQREFESRIKEDIDFFKSENSLLKNSSFSIMTKDIENLESKSKELLNKQSNITSKYEAQIGEYQNELDAISKSNKRLKALKNEIQEIHKLIKEKFEEQQIDLYIKSIKAKILLTNQNLNSLTSDIGIFEHKISAEDYLDQKKFNENLVFLNIRKKEIIEFTNKISKEVSDIGNEELIIGYNKEIENLNKHLDKIFTKLNVFRALKFDYYTLPLDFNGKNIDVVQFELKRHHKHSKENKIDVYEPYNIWIKGGFKIDVSAGAFITSLVDGKYSISNKTNIDNQGNEETYQIITHDNPGRFQYGFGSLINISPRLGQAWVKPTLNVGALFTSDQKFQFLLGGGLVLGKEQRIILHGGLSMGAITSIADNFKADGQSRYNLGEVTAPPTQEKFSFGHFFGVTYNFGKIKSQDEIKNK